MAVVSDIEWTDATWNPVRGCTKISPGCTHCYAHTFAERFRGVSGHAYEQGFDLRLVPEKLVEPLKWPSSKRVFVNSMSDLFHEDVPVGYIARVADVICTAPWHTFQILTKRPSRLAALSATTLDRIRVCSHVWWGVSVENKRHGLPRLSVLRDLDLGLRFLSIEPLLEDLGEIDLSGIGWVIVGGESGPGARPIHPDWVRSLRDQCLAARIPFFFKQWGGVQKKKSGRLLDGQSYDEMPDLAASVTPPKSIRDRMILDLQKRWMKPLDTERGHDSGQINILAN
jgi:protein gp37